MEYYTYAYLREDGTPYYIGKGRGDRAYKKGSRVFAPPPKNRIIKLKQNLTEEEAFKHEIYMIALFGRKDLGTGILHNRTDGGEGLSGAIRSKETRRKISESMKGKSPSEEHRKKLSEVKKGIPQEHIKKLNELKKGKPISKEHRIKISESMKGKYVGKNNPNYGKRGEDSCNYGTKWWNDGCGNNKMSKQCPGEGWVLGRGRIKS